MNKNNIVLVVTFCFLKGLASNTIANESITPFLIYMGGPKLSTQFLPMLAEYDLLLMNRLHYDQINGNTWGAIKALSPSAKIFLYQSGPQVADNTDTYPIKALNNLGRYNVSRGSSQGSINKDNPDWFLVNSNGQRLTSTLNSRYFELDFGNKEFASYWSRHTLEDIAFQEWRADGVFIDNAVACSDSFLRNKPSYVPVKYSNCQSWNTNMSDFIVRVSGELQKNNQQVMVNFGNSHQDSGAEAWRELGQRSSAPNIMMEEGAFVAAWGGRGVVLHWPVKNWQQQIDLPASVNLPVAMVSHTDLAPGQQGVSWAGEAVSHSQVMRFAFGSYLLARNRSGGLTTYFLFDDDRKRRGSSYDRLISAEMYDKFDVGVPVAKYEKRLQNQDLFFRQYTKGYVYVNPSSEKIVAIKADSDAEFSSEYDNARKVGADWFFDLNPHDAAIVKAKSTVSTNKQSTPPAPPVLRTQ